MDFLGHRGFSDCSGLIPEIPGIDKEQGAITIKSRVHVRDASLCHTTHDLKRSKVCVYDMRAQRVDPERRGPVGGWSHRTT